MTEELLVIWENNEHELQFSRQHNSEMKRSYRHPYSETVGHATPENYRLTPIAKSTYRQYRRRLTGATVDIVICRRAVVHQKKRSCITKPQVLGMLRAHGNAYANQWFMPGGSLPAYELIPDFLKRKTKEECGIAIEQIEAIIGVYRISAEDTADSSITACYVTTVPEKVEVCIDKNHSAYKWFTKEDLMTIRSSDKHPYPMRVFLLALQTTPY